MCSFFPKTLFRSDWGRREGSAPQISLAKSKGRKTGPVTHFATIYKTFSDAGCQVFWPTSGRRQLVTSTISAKPYPPSAKDHAMDPQTVSKLEQKFQEAMIDILVKMGLKKVPLLPSQTTTHLMAKAAVTVYEAAVENNQREA